MLRRYFECCGQFLLVEPANQKTVVGFLGNLALDRGVENPLGQRQQGLVETVAEPVVDVVRFSRHLGVTNVEAEILVPVSVVVEELRLRQIGGRVPHVPAGGRVVDLAHQFVGQTRLTDTPLGDDGEDVRKLFRLLIHEMDEVLELIEELRLADDGVRQRIARNAARSPFVLFLFYAHSVTRFRVAFPSLWVLFWFIRSPALRHSPTTRDLASCRIHSVSRVPIVRRWSGSRRSARFPAGKNTCCRTRGNNWSRIRRQ